MPGRLRHATTVAVGSSTAAATAGAPITTTTTTATTTTKKNKYGIPRLEFNETLSWRAGKTIPVADLLTRLHKLAAELRQYEYEDVEIDGTAFARLALDLAHPNLLGHKDRGVKAVAMACVVDVLKICAPNAPFSNPQLKDIFTVFISAILPRLADPTDAYNTLHVYILNSLTEFKSIVLITDLDRPESLILSLFSTCFDLVSGSIKNTSGVELSKSLEYQLNTMLEIVVDEVTLPLEVADIIISQFLRVDSGNTHVQSAKSTRKPLEPQDEKQSNLLLKEYPPAYNTAKFICTSCPEKMTAQISQYFSNVIADASAARQSQALSKRGGRRMSDLDASDDDFEDLADLVKAHRLIRELWRACPDVLVNVIPQLEAELSAESVSLRELATETLGDITAGIGIAGPPPSTVLDPASYPLPSIESASNTVASLNLPLTPVSPRPFAVVHTAAYQSFLSRRIDKSPAVRSAWATAVGRILLTSAGGTGFSDSEQKTLLSGLAQMLGDADDKVRLAAIRAVATFGYSGIINCLGSDGGIGKSGTVFDTLADRVKDKKHPVREEAIKLLGQLWGVASSDIERGVDKVIAVLGEVPSRLLGAYFTNDQDVHALLDKAIFESLLPLSYPPVKVQISRTESQKTRAKDKEADSQEGPAIDPDAIRVRRILTLIRSLDQKSRQVFFSMQSRQVQMTKIMAVFLKGCEDYNGGVMEENEATIKADLKKYIDTLAKTFPDNSKVSADLWKFVKIHDRRNYQLIRFAMGPQYDYRTVTKAIKELTKRIQSGPANTQSLLETITPLLHRCSLIVYNRSHVPTIMEISRTDESGLAEAANEILKEISSRNPEVLKTHIQDLCKELEEHAPSSSNEEEPSAADTLKACAAFARKYPADVSKDRKFLVSMTQYALFARSPRAAKHAVSIVMAVADKKEMYAKEILTKALEKFSNKSPHFLSRLATISQICLLAPAAANMEADAILQIAIADILPRNQKARGASDSSSSWMAKPDDETISKELALKIMVNRCRSEDDKANPSEFEKLVTPLYKILMRLINDDGEVTPTKDTPKSQRARLRLAAARYLLKLCSHRRRCEELVTPQMFLSIASIVLNPPSEVRVGFVNQLKKYLGQNRLNYRWFTILFLLAFEPNMDLRNSTTTWLKSRHQFFVRQQLQAKIQGLKGNENVMESLLARLLSLLAYHPDYPEKDSESYNIDVLDFAKYICFYLSSVATEDNLSLVFHVAQRVKQARDVVTDTDEMSERLYVLSDLAQATIRTFADLMPTHHKGMNLLQTWPGRVSLPTSLFKALPSHQAAQQIAEKIFLPEEVSSEVEKLVRAFVKAGKSGHQQQQQHGAKKVAAAATTHERKKRKSGDSVDVDDEDDYGDVDNRQAVKKVKKDRSINLPVRKAAMTTATATATKTSKHKRKSSEISSSEMPSRKSTRISTTANVVSYADRDSDDDDREMEEMQETQETQDIQVEADSGPRAYVPGLKRKRKSEDAVPSSREKAAAKRGTSIFDREMSETTDDRLAEASSPRGKATKAKGEVTIDDHESDNTAVTDEEDEGNEAIDQREVENGEAEAAASSSGLSLPPSLSQSPPPSPLKEKSQVKRKRGRPPKTTIGRPPGQRRSSTSASVSPPSSSARKQATKTKTKKAKAITTATTKSAALPKRTARETRRTKA